MIILFETVFMNIKEKTSATGAIFILSIYTAFINEIGSSFLSLESIHVVVRVYLLYFGTELILKNTSYWSDLNEMNNYAFLL